MCYYIIKKSKGGKQPIWVKSFTTEIYTNLNTLSLHDALPISSDFSNAVVFVLDNAALTAPETLEFVVDVYKRQT